MATSRSLGSVAFAVTSVLATVLCRCSSSSAVGDCTPSDDHCEGNTAYFCDIGSDHKYHLGAFDCGDRKCVRAATTVLCATTAAPEPLCPPSNPNTEACDGSDMIQCEQGFAVARFSCASCTACQSNCSPSQPSVCARGLGARCANDADCLPGYVCLGSNCAVSCGSQPWCPTLMCSSSWASGALVQGCGWGYDL